MHIPFVLLDTYLCGKVNKFCQITDNLFLMFKREDFQIFLPLASNNNKL